MATHDHFSVQEKCEQRLGEALKALLETKHLYQYVAITLLEIINQMLPDNLQYGALRKHMFDVVRGRWCVRSGNEPQLPRVQVLTVLALGLGSIAEGARPWSYTYVYIRITTTHLFFLYTPVFAVQEGASPSWWKRNTLLPASD